MVNTHFAPSRVAHRASRLQALLLADDADGGCDRVLVAGLQALAVRSQDDALAHRDVESRRRCLHFAHAADVAARLLPRLAATLRQRAYLPAAGAALAAASPPTVDRVLVLELGWLAMDVGFEREGRALLHAAGVVLHGAMGGALLEAQGLMSVGRTLEAAELLECALGQHRDDDGMPSALLAWLWHALDDERWIVAARRVVSQCSNQTARLLCNAQLDIASRVA